MKKIGMVIANGGVKIDSCQLILLAKQLKADIVPIFPLEEDRINDIEQNQESNIKTFVKQRFPKRVRKR